MHFLNLSQFFNEMKKNEEESFLSSVKCRIRTVVLWSSFTCQTLFEALACSYMFIHIQTLHIDLH